MNVNGNWNMRASLRYQKRWKKRFNLSARTGASFAQSVALVNEERARSKTAASPTILRIMPTFVWVISRNGEASTCRAIGVTAMPPTNSGVHPTIPEVTIFR